ncbi:MAG: 6,7-dimethyl-8-ribityllumazine synthase [Candidatus Kaiserbacteria bacterium GW2011_GWC2_49_12]|uniref:6,7-dimethyl-8-ribityllumazine synthase n=3 Tax=Candidatus Kaiseribacteriota TaxID=1752734 RepID=A0A0G1YSK2_9BACT|nr:MAG: 6,7-dimethyl-8-ribityllumazine synthase [Candidatus Kaiserbacteria bacterium GW2011_GWC2_49_12]KKW18002.1 MAG: 6,7-dimethyl-8-ribityllumazine synthase [Candidatus Kaiserbacteria bacterium GW2011_GWB1_50_17]KKW18426.1 MAG: 6,7-dimethyl-8-ribityllumazine synthase [Candidatus Kaiserbacteria bacterium GW2011_GWA1_50_28]HCM43631.1 6,7-dimethyl-8-ribityllumazine synthase [Candidatus Kaiserbacteria bacterium]
MKPARNRARAGAPKGSTERLTVSNRTRDTADVRIAIVSSSFRPEVTKSLEKHCVATLEHQGVQKNQLTFVRVPGALEIPLAAKRLAQKGAYSAIIVFGAIYKGKTYHFEQIANECSRGCMDVSLQYEIPVIFEVLAVYNPRDAIERATRAVENKGAEAAMTALSMIALLKKI